MSDMASEPNDAQMQSVQLRVQPSPDAPEPAPLYSNRVQINFTPEDFLFYFGWYSVPPLAEPPEGGLLDVPVEPVARVVLPVILIRNVIALLQRQLEAYENSFGPIPEHPAKPPWMTQAGVDDG